MEAVAYVQLTAGTIAWLSTAMTISASRRHCCAADPNNAIILGSLTTLEAVALRTLRSYSVFPKTVSIRSVWSGTGGGGANVELVDIQPGNFG